jgi:hypothetical protein
MTSSAIFLYIAASASPFSNRVELSAVPFEIPIETSREENASADTQSAL